MASAIKDALPGESFIYYGDTRHAPYGDKSKSTIVEYSRRITAFLKQQDCKAVVIACNTASAVAFKELQRTVRMPQPPVVAEAPPSTQPASPALPATVESRQPPTAGASQPCTHGRLAVVTSSRIVWFPVSATRSSPVGSCSTEDGESSPPPCALAWLSAEPGGRAGSKAGGGRASARHDGGRG